MGQPGKGAYSEARYQVSQAQSLLDRVSVDGTIAADAEISRITAFTNIRAIEAQVPVHTGGTAAGPQFTIGKSLAGTGAVVAFGTINVGTSADSTVLDIALTETDINDGDDIVVQKLAGTAAETPSISVILSYAENFISD